MNKLIGASIFAAIFSLAPFGCQRSSQSGLPVMTHKLVVNGNEQSIPIYSDERSYLNTSHMKQEGGVEGAVGDMKQSLTTKQLDDQTSVEIVSSDENGSIITVTDGPMKGQTGFVAKHNID